MLLKMDVKNIYRRSSKERCFVWDIEEASLVKLHEGMQISFAKFSPDGSKIAYMYDNNLYYHDLNTDRQITVTTDGKFNSVINGGTDWV